MKPNKVIAELIRIASGLRNSQNPSRKLVAADLRRLIAVINKTSHQTIEILVYKTETGFTTDPEEDEEWIVEEFLNPIEVDVDVHLEDYGIGSYEYGSERGYHSDVQPEIYLNEHDKVSVTFPVEFTLKVDEGITVSDEDFENFKRGWKPPKVTDNRTSKCGCDFDPESGGVGRRHRCRDYEHDYAIIWEGVYDPDKKTVTYTTTSIEFA